VDRPIAIDLFAGCGGMSLGLEAAGFDIAAAVEFDAIHSLVHHVNFPYCATICRDLVTVTAMELRATIGHREIDLIAGGPPCQGFSVMGKRIFEDPRNGLIYEYLRLIRELQPKYFIFENVPGLAKGKQRLFLEQLITEFQQAGYGLTEPIQVLNSANYGVAQNRQRLIILGHRWDMPSLVYPEFSHSSVINHSIIDHSITNSSLTDHYDYSQIEPNSPRQTALDLGFSDSLNSIKLPLCTVEQVLGDLATIPPFVGKDHGIPREKLHYPQEKMFKLCHRRHPTNHEQDLVWGHIGSDHKSEIQARFAATPIGTVDPQSRFFKLDPQGQCHTLRAGTNRDRGAHTAPRPIHYIAPRCITIREAARLHSFPDWFLFHQTIWHGFRQIGNAVTPLLAYGVGTAVIQALRIPTNDLVIRDLPAVDRNLLHYNIQQASAYWGIDEVTIAKRQRQPARPRSSTKIITEITTEPDCACD
jgi:DNA (cytosine-5)-methyltransferase 1